MEKQPYPNIPVYVVHPTDGERHRWALHRNYLLPISDNLEQAELKIPWRKLGLLMCLLECHRQIMHYWSTKSQLESISNSALTVHSGQPRVDWTDWVGQLRCCE